MFWELTTSPRIQYQKLRLIKMFYIGKVDKATSGLRFTLKLLKTLSVQSSLTLITVTRVRNSRSPDLTHVSHSRKPSVRSEAWSWALRKHRHLVSLIAEWESKRCQGNGPSPALLTLRPGTRPRLPAETGAIISHLKSKRWVVKLSIT